MVALTPIGKSHCVAAECRTLLARHGAEVYDTYCVKDETISELALVTAEGLYGFERAKRMATFQDSGFNPAQRGANSFCT